MSDVDYDSIFRNGQLQMAEPEHLAMLHRYFGFYLGTSEMETFKQQYPKYLQQFHPEVLAPAPVASEVLPEDLPIGDTVKVEEPAEEIAEEPKSDLKDLLASADKPKRGRPKNS